MRAAVQSQCDGDSTVQNSFSWYVFRVYLFRESRAGSQVAASKRPTRQITFKPIFHDESEGGLKTNAPERGGSRHHCDIFSLLIG
jgi:hypothetical protein